MDRNQTADLQDTRVDVKVVLSGLWISMLFIFAYVDIFGRSTTHDQGCRNHQALRPANRRR